MVREALIRSHWSMSQQKAMICGMDQKHTKKHKSTIAEMQNTNAKGFNILKTFTLSTFFGRFVNHNALKTADRPDINRMQ